MRFTYLFFGLVAAGLVVACSKDSSGAQPTPTFDGSPPPIASPAATNTPVPGATPPAQATPPTSTGGVIGRDNLGALVVSAKTSLPGVQRLVWSSDSETLYVVRSESVSALMADKPGAETVFTPPSGSQVVDYSPAGTQAVVRATDGTLSVIDRVGLQQALLPGSYATANFAPDGKSIALTSRDTLSIVIVDATTKETTKTLTGFETAAPVYSGWFSSNGNAIIYLSRATVQPQDIVSGALGPRLEHEDFVVGFDMSLDGLSLATASGQQVTIWSLAAATAGQKDKTLALDSIANRVAFTHEGEILAVGSQTALTFFDVATGTQLEKLSRNTMDVFFSPDGHALAARDQDGEVVILQPEEKRP